MKLKIYLSAFLLTSTIVFFPAFLAGEEEFCLTGGGGSNEGVCEDNPGMPSHTDPSQSVNVKWCNLEIDTRAPEVDGNCSGNSLEPKLH